MKTDSAKPSLANRPSTRLEKVPPVQEISAVLRYPPVPENIRSLLGTAWILEGENAELYEALLARIAAEMQPVDLIEWLLLKDIVALTWDIQRSRHHRNSIMRLARRQAMERVLSLVLEKRSVAAEFIDDRAQAVQLAADWFNGDKKTIKAVDQLLTQAGLSMTDVTAQALSIRSGEIGRIEERNDRCEQRRDAILRQIERRRAGLGSGVRRASEEVVDAQFRELTPGVSGGETIGGAPAQSA
jgi:hypothetical protein